MWELQLKSLSIINNMFDAIILVDDNPTTLFYNEDIISEVLPNTEIVTYEKSKTFLDDYLGNKFKDYSNVLLLLDLNMPDYLGYELLEEIEEEMDSLDNLSVIILTSSKLKSDIEKSSRFTQIVGFIEKPVTNQNLKNILNQ
jgi:CheY-like chemotaxis protein